MELVSIITPYYKKKKFIREAVLSAIKQTYKKLEIIIVYDDQNLKDLKYIEAIVSLDDRISLIVNNKNIGAGLSRNLAIRSSRGTYIAFLDADDIWKENKIEEQINFMKKNDSKICHTSYEIIDYNKNIIGKRVARNFKEIKDLLKSCDIGLSTVMMKKIFFSNECSFVNLKTKEDFIFWLMLLKQNHAIEALDVNLSYWRKLNDSLSSSSIQKLTDGFKVYYKYMNFSLIKSLIYLLLLSFNYVLKELRNK